MRSFGKQVALDEIVALRTRIRELEAALEPFAEEAPETRQGVDSVGDGAEVELWLIIMEGKVRIGSLLLGDFRRAAAALKGDADEREG